MTSINIPVVKIPPLSDVDEMKLDENTNQHSSTNQSKLIIEGLNQALMKSNIEHQHPIQSFEQQSTCQTLQIN